jgi:hypothetical protein
MPHYAPTAGRATWGQGSHTALARIRVAHRAFLGHIAQATTVVGRAKLGIVAALVELTTNVLTVRARAAAPCRPHCVGPAAGLLPCGMAMLRLPSLIALGLAAPWCPGCAAPAEGRRSQGIFYIRKEVEEATSKCLYTWITSKTAYGSNANRLDRQGMSCTRFCIRGTR